MDFTNLYLPADESFVINDKDEHLTPIRISLPKPPNIKLIEGYGKHPKDQRFTRLEPPKELLDLEKQSIKEMKFECEKGKNAATPYRAYKKFWELFESKQDELKDSVEYLNRFWWHRIHGYWFFLRGKPTYITGKHFDYLHLWFIPENNFSHPDFRHDDKDWFLYMEYLNTCTETFADLDENGKAVKVDGKYRMIDDGNRKFYGGANTKKRRDGATHSSLSWGNSVSTTGASRVCGNISYTKDQMEKHWKLKVMPVFGKQHLWILPASQSVSTSTSIEYSAPQTAYGEEFINSQVDYAKTSNQSSMDGSAYDYIYCDEEGKTVTVSVLKRWNTLKFCLSSGKKIKGFSLHPSTVEEMDESGGKEFKALLDQSDFYVRKKDDGQTISGLGMSFISACRKLEGYIDSYGISVDYEVTDWQREEGFTRCAYDVLKSERDAVMAKYEDTGDPSYLETYRSLQRKFPLNYMDSFIGESGELLPSVFIDRAILKCETSPLIERPRKYDLKWVNNVPFTRVEAVENPDGKWTISRMPIEDEQNQVMQEVAYNIIKNEYYDRRRPTIQSKFVIGCDPIKYHSSTKARNAMAKGSKPAIVVDLMRLPSDTAQNPKDWEGFVTACTYMHMPMFFDDFVDDLIKTAFFYSAYINLEGNVAGSTLQRMEDTFNDGFLLYDVNKKGIEKDNAGTYTSLATKSDGIIQLSDYLKMRFESEKHLDLLNQCKQMKELEDMTKLDLIAAKLMALDGANILRKRNGLKPANSFDPFQFMRELGEYQEYI